VIGSPRSARSMHQGRGIFHDMAVMNRMARDGIRNHFVGLSDDLQHGSIAKRLLAGGELILDAASLIPAVNGATTELRAMRWASLFSAPRIMAASELSSAAAMEGFYANAPMLVAESGVEIESFAIKQQVLDNIAESRAAREASSFPVLIAKEDQMLSGYNVDQWTMTTLRKGDVVYGGLPGQSAYYTSERTLLASRYTRESLFQSLQVRPDPVLGYRPLVGVYEVTQNVRVPTGIVNANPELGVGGCDQFFINNFSRVLQLTNRVELGERYEYMPTNRLYR